MIELRNDFHGTSVRIRKKHNDYVSRDLVRRWRRALCPDRRYTGCGCYEDAAGQRGEGREVEVVPAGWYRGDMFYVVQERLSSRAKEDLAAETEKMEKPKRGEGFTIYDFAIGMPVKLVFRCYSSDWEEAGDSDLLGLIIGLRERRVIVGLPKPFGGLSALVLLDESGLMVRNPVLKDLSVYADFDECPKITTEQFRKSLVEHLYRSTFPGEPVPEKIDYPFVLGFYED